MLRRLFIFGLLAMIYANVAFSVPSPGDTVIDAKTLDVAINSPNKDDFPDAKKVLLFGEKIIKLDSDGGYTVEWHDIYRVLTFMGKKELSNVKYLYDSSYEKVNISRARSLTIGEDSTFAAQVSDSLQINDITAPGLSNAGIYSDLKQRVVTIPGVVDSSIVDIAGKIESVDRPKKPFGGIEFLAKSDPVVSYRLVIEVPMDRELVYRSANGAPAPTVQGNRYIWTISDWDGFVPEERGPLGRDLLPCVFYSVTKSWTLAADMVQAQFFPKSMPDEKVSNLVEKIAGKLDGRAKIDSLTSWVARNIRMIDIDLGDAGYIPNSAAVVLKNSYGDSRDRSVLLVSMLRAAGFNPNLVLLPPRDSRVLEEVPAVAQFMRMAVEIDMQTGERVWLWTEDDFTAPGRFPGYDGEKALMISVGKGELVELPNIGPEKNGMDQNYEIALDAEGGISGTMQILFRGDYERRLRNEFRDVKQKRRRQRVESVVSNIGGGELAGDTSFSFSALEDLNIKPTMSAEFVSKDFAFIQDDMMIFNFPGNPLDFAGSTVPTNLDEREEPLVLRTPFKENYSFTLRVPDEYMIVWASEPTSFKNSIGEMSVSSAIGDNEVEYNVSLSIEKTWIESSEYIEARDLIRSYMAPKNRMVLLERKPAELPEEIEEGE